MIRSGRKNAKSFLSLSDIKSESRRSEVSLRFCFHDIIHDHAKQKGAHRDHSVVCAPLRLTNFLNAKLMKVFCPTFFKKVGEVKGE